VVACGYGAASTLVLANRPVLLEGGCALNRRCVDTRGLVDVVIRSVRVDGPDKLGSAAGIVVAEILEDVVLDERVRRPAVNR
jgi:hypothetical protein